MRDIDSLILELVNYALMNELIEDDDKIYETNRLLEVFEKSDLIQTVRQLRVMLRARSISQEEYPKFSQTALKQP